MSGQMGPPLPPGPPGPNGLPGMPVPGAGVVKKQTVLYRITQPMTHFYESY